MEDKNSNYLCLGENSDYYLSVLKILSPKLTVLEQKVFIYMVACAKFDNRRIISKESFNYSFEISSLCHILDIIFNSQNYIKIKKTLKSLRDKSIQLIDSNKETTTSFLSKCIIHKNDGIIEYKFDEDIIPYLSIVQININRSNLSSLLHIRRSSSFTMYLLCKSCLSKHFYTITYTQLRQLLHITDTAYPVFSQFDRCVLSAAIDDINRYSDIIVNYTIVYIKRLASIINFEIQEKNLI